LDATVDAMRKPSAELDKEAINYYINERREEAKLVDEWLASRVVGTGGTVIGDPY